MIGPHQGKELELMLSGKKHLAIFCDAVIKDYNIPEEIIPDKAFAPYVADKTISRFTKDFISPKLLHPGRYVCFTLPGHEWRAHAFLWLHGECVAGNRPFDEAYEYFVGRLLDYEETDIEDYVTKFPRPLNNKTSIHPQTLHHEEHRKRTIK